MVKKTKKCPECKANLISAPRQLTEDGWVCNKEGPCAGNPILDWRYNPILDRCDKPIKFVCKNWEGKRCSTGRCGRHGEVAKRAVKAKA